jgi:hemolysin III
MPSSSHHVLAQETITESKPRVKPRLRGVSHRYAFIVALLPCLLLVIEAPAGRATLASAVYAGSLLGVLGTSALYHGINWTPQARFWLARLDLLMIFVLIAGTYTPIAMLRLDPQLASVVLACMWSAVILGGVLKTLWTDPPKWASAVIFVSFGSVVILFLPQLVAAIGVPASALIALGGALYVAGAIVYGLQRPDPIPAVFGYHELFHVFVIAGAAVHFVTIATYVIPAES